MKSRSSQSKRVVIGCVHGRFQPPHKGHREYILAAKELCDFLWVGITQYDLLTKKECALAPHRSEASANPLTYCERIDLLSKMLVAENIPRRSFAFIPFPIDEPNHLSQFLPTSVTCFTTIYEPWNREKIKALKGLGYDVRVLWERTVEQKLFSGGKIRQSIRKGDNEWEQSVPAAILSDIKNAHIELR
jgi:cytidyltransferase-like protein